MLLPLYAEMLVSLPHTLQEVTWRTNGASARPPDQVDEEVEVEPQRHVNERFAVGQPVEWDPPPEVAAQLEIPVHHPGRVTSPAVYAVDVSWVDKYGEYFHDGVFDQDWLSPISEDEFRARTAEVRASSWVGFAQ
jgi:hypothetical protein